MVQGTTGINIFYVWFLSYTHLNVRQSNLVSRCIMGGNKQFILGCFGISIALHSEINSILIAPQLPWVMGLSTRAALRGKFVLNKEVGHCRLIHVQVFVCMTKKIFIFYPDHTLNLIARVSTIYQTWLIDTSCRERVSQHKKQVTLTSLFILQLCILKKNKHT